MSKYLASGCEVYVDRDLNDKESLVRRVMEVDGGDNILMNLFLETEEVCIVDERTNKTNG